MNSKPPQFLNDVYRDLRDRNLLLPVVVLLIALVAVPVPPVAAPSGDASAVTSAVLVDDTVDVRNYRKRLAKLKSKNPFEGNFGVRVPASGSGGDGGGGEITDTGSSIPDAEPSPAPPTPTPTGSSPTGSSPTGSSPTGSSPSVPSSPSPESTSTDISGGSPSGSAGDTTDTDTETQQPQIRFYAGRVDVTVGPIGKGKDMDNVKYLTFLPDDSAPIAAFVGLTGSGASESAVFAITSLAEVGDGEGTCAPHQPDPCQFLTLKPGESRYIKYNGKSFRLAVRDTHIVPVKDPREQSAEGNGGTADE